MMHEWSSIVSRFASVDFFVDLSFWGYFAVAVLALRAFPRHSGVREWVLLASNAGMLLALPRFDGALLGIMCGLCAVTYGCGRLLLLESSALRRASRAVVAVAGLGVTLLLLAFFKYAAVQRIFLSTRPATPGAADVLLLIGVSYSSFKAMHFVIEAYKRTLERPTFLRFLNYILFFPSFISGPINRFNHFVEHSWGGEFRRDVGAGLERIVHGLFKKTVLTILLLPYTLSGVTIQDLTLWQIAVGLYAYAFYFYFDFSGYTDLAIGCARIMGFGLPENFNRPFMKRNIQQLWANWHISLTSWLTDYVYWPLVRRLRNIEWFKPRPVLLSNVAIVVTFVACGIWHGDTASFLIWGLYHGLGIAAVNTYQKWKRQVRHPLARAYFGSTYSHALGTIATFNFFAIGLLPFALDFSQIRLLLAHVFRGA